MKRPTYTLSLLFCFTALVIPPVLADFGSEPVLRDSIKPQGNPDSVTIKTITNSQTTESTEARKDSTTARTQTKTSSSTNPVTPRTAPAPVTTGADASASTSASTSTTTTTTETTTTTTTKDGSDTLQLTAEKITRLRHNAGLAKRMARYHWLDKAAAANPLVIQSICNFHSAAAILAKHPRLGDIAEQDHYLCRRLTRWKDVARILAANPQAERVISLDPQGTYTAIQTDKKFGKALAKNPMFDQMVNENPELAKVFAQYM